ncbi:ABC transporter ATP-binding protein [Paracoccus aestuariivivens]|uniref:ATP-binding cassette domain-containing protein n=1 Tax=Paracoccus aestuariivivens TaxID=1820333 RepID=A0A6L6J4Q6_9RHOB|nr:ATP-binding cassette domain-containing protein [Paracoccus aestuariivivens]
MTAEVRFEAIHHRFGNFTALHKVDLTIAAGEFIVLLGPSGCGKTTLLSILGGFVTPTEGKVIINGKDMTHVPPRGRPTTTMFQDYALFPHMTLLDNVGFGLRMRGVGKSERRTRAQEMLEMVGLGDKASRRPHELSGGQRQRVALARALAVSPDVLLLDEPLGALDMKLRRQMQDELKAIQRRVGTTFVHVTHDQEEAMAVADRIVVMNQGRIEHCGSPEDVYLRPASLFSANFMGEMNRIPVTANGQNAQSPFGPIAMTMTGREGVLCIRPENIGFSGDVSLGPARLVESGFFGTHHRCHFEPLAAEGTRIVAHLPQGSQPGIGQNVELFATNAVILRDEVAA